MSRAYCPRDFFSHHGGQGNITLHVQMGKQVKALKDDPDFLTQPFQVGFFSVHMIPVDPDITLLDELETVDASQEGTFARTASADEGHLFALLNGQIDILQDFEFAESFMNPLNSDERHSASFPFFGSALKADNTD